MTNSTTPNTAANGGQILTDERILATIEIVREHGHFPSLAFPSDAAAIAFARAIETDLRVSRAAVPASEPVVLDAAGIRFRFFKHLSTAERMKVFRVFLNLSEEVAAEVTNHSRENRLLSAIFKSAAAPAPVSGMPYLAKLYVRKQSPLEALTFDEFVQYGRDSGANIVNGMPWSFQYKGMAITHENDDCYLIPAPNGKYFQFTREHMLVTFADGSTVPEDAASFIRDYMQIAPTGETK